jgi:hypothetical protein
MFKAEDNINMETVTILFENGDDINGLTEGKIFLS